jgi:hypothetical protein
VFPTSTHGLDMRSSSMCYHIAFMHFEVSKLTQLLFAYLQLLFLVDHRLSNHVDEHHDPKGAP